jgi:hypothetical protein
VSPGWRETCGQNPADLRGRFVWDACDITLRAPFTRAMSGRETVRVPLAKRLWNFTPILSSANELLAVATVIADSRDRA